MNNTLKSLSVELCKPVFAGLERTPKSHVLAQAYSKPSLMTAMYHVMGFDGKKLERVANVNEEALKKYHFFLVRPFYHSLHVTIYVNTGKSWNLFGKITRREVSFEPEYQALAFKAASNDQHWRNQVQATGITHFKPPVVDVLPSMADVIKRFGQMVVDGGELGEFVLLSLDGMTRSGDVQTYVRAAMSVLHFNVVDSQNGIILESDIEGSTVQIQYTIMGGTPPVKEHLHDNIRISEYLKKIRDNPDADYPGFFDIVMLRAIKNALVIIPFDKWQSHSITYRRESNRDISNPTAGHDEVIVETYMRMKDTKSEQKYIRIHASIKVPNK